MKYTRPGSAGSESSGRKCGLYPDGGGEPVKRVSSRQKRLDLSF